MAWLSGFTNRLKVIIPSDNIDSTLTDFPILLKLTTDCGLTGFDASIVFDELELDANRFKIAVTASDGTTQRYVEIEKWDDSSEEAWLWVKVPSVAASGKTELYFYYDSTASDNTTYVGDIGDSPATQVWSNNFWAVFHMGDTSSPFVNSLTTSGTNLNVTGSPTFATPAKVAEGVDWGSSQNAGQGTTGFTASNVTVESWVKQDSAATAIRRWVTLSSEIAVIRQDSGATGQFKWYIKTDSVIRSMTVNNVIDTNWGYFAGTWDGTTMRMYKDGSEIGTPNVPGGTLNTGAGMSINSATENFEGLQDEIRVSTTARTESWLKATYYTCEDNLLYMEEDVTQPEWLGTWDQRIALTIDSTKVDEDLLDFPLLITVASGVGGNNADLTPVFDELDYAFSPNDTFSGTNGDPPDATRWTAPNVSAGASAEINNNKFRMSVGSGATRSAQTYTTYYLQGDFDVQVDFDIISGPNTNNWWASLTAHTTEPDWADKHRAIFYREYTGSTHRFLFQSYDGSYHTEASQAESSTSGKMRVTRVGASWTCYYDTGGGWQTMGPATFINKTGPVHMRLRVENGTPGDPLVTWDWDNFTVTSGTVIWGNNDAYVSNFPNRQKFAITTANGTSQCYAEIERWEQHNEVAHIWAKIPVVSSSEDTTLYLYYDSNEADNTTYVGDVTDAAAQNVWDSDFVMVQHMANNPTANASEAMKDSTSNGNTGTPVNFEWDDYVDGHVAKATSHDGDEYVEVGHDSTIAPTDVITVEMLAHHSNWSTYITEGVLLSKTEAGGYALNVNGSAVGGAGNAGFLVRRNGTYGATGGSISGLSGGDWHYFVGTYDGRYARYYVDGSLVDTDDAGADYPIQYSYSNSVIMGAEPGSGASPTGAYFIGSLDEGRISNVVKSAAYIETNYYNLWDNLTSYGAPETEPAPSVGTFNGYVELAGQPVARIVALYRRSTGEMQDYTTSNPNTGYFELSTPHDELHYLVILPDIGDGYQPIARDQIDPV
jgi:hypothetical protein